MSQARVIHVGDTVHYKCGSFVGVGIIERITESDLAVMMELRASSGNTLFFRADDNRVCLAESLNGVTVGADGTMATSKPATEPEDTESGAGDEPIYTFGYVVQYHNESFGNLWYTGELDALWSFHRNQALVFASRYTAERATADCAGYAAYRARPLVAGDAERIIGEAVVRYAIQVYLAGVSHAWYVAFHDSWAVYPVDATLYEDKGEALRRLAAIKGRYPRARVVPIFPKPEGRCS